MALVTTAVPSPKFQLYVVMAAPVSPEVDALKEHDRPEHVEANAANGALGVGDTKLVAVLIDVVSSVTVTVAMSKPDAAYT